jgi:hypothetical protein
MVKQVTAKKNGGEKTQETEHGGRVCGIRRFSVSGRCRRSPARIFHRQVSCYSSI